MATKHRILTPRSCRVASNTVRLYSGNRWVRPDGRTWTPIAEVLRTQYDARTATFRVEVGDAWVELQSASLARVRHEVIHRTRNFGWLVEPDDVGDVLEYAVRTSEGVKRTGDGFLLAAYDGVGLGVYFRGWQQRFGGRCEIGSDRIRLDVSAEKARLAERGLSEKLDLDPETVTGDAGWKLTWMATHPDKGDAYHAARSDGGLWKNCAGVAGNNDSLDARSDYNPPVGAYYGLAARQVWGFDTSSYSASRIESATMHIRHVYGPPKSAKHIALLQPDITAPPVAADFSKLTDAIGTSRDIGVFPDVSGTWASRDLPTANYLQSSTFMLAFLLDFDRQWAEGDSFTGPYGEDFATTEIEEYSPYLELTLPPTASRVTLLDAGS